LSYGSTHSCRSPNALSPRASRDDVWERRYREINSWERYLVDSGFRLVKLFLNISREEQRKRFPKRIDLPEKNWKFPANDVNERSHWDQYQEAFSEMLTHTSTEWAPWHVIPADHKWFARVAAGTVLAQTLMDIDPAVPERGSSGAPGVRSGQGQTRAPVKR